MLLMNHWSEPFEVEIANQLMLRQQALLFMVFLLAVAFVLLLSCGRFVQSISPYCLEIATALALVFSLFSINPAPFCLLDEVDAPLDDENTSRFINLVNEMSEKVQFIFVTHNKISMEKSTHLLGVTMRDLGVSKVVSVDVEQAMELAQS